MLSTGLSARCSHAGTALSVNRRQRPVSVRASGAVRVDAKKGDIKKAMFTTHSRLLGDFTLKAKAAVDVSTLLAHWVQC
jgi:type IV secretory pathway TrbL component